MNRVQQVLLVDECDRVVGTHDKLSAHRGSGRLHRAFSVLVFNSAGEMLLQLRSRKKYHFGGLWSNACCGHPGRDEKIADAAAQRLLEEFGFRIPVRETFVFRYQAHDSASGLTENEFDHVLEGTFDGTPKPNPNEIDDFRWIRPDQLSLEVARDPAAYTPWFRILLEKRAAD